MKFFIDKRNMEGALSQLETGLDKLSFEDNFEGFAWSGELTPGQEVLIPNELKPRVPSGFVVTQLEGNATLTKGPTDWNDLHVSLRNGGTSSTLFVAVYFYR